MFPALRGWKHRFDEGHQRFGPAVPAGAVEVLQIRLMVVADLHGEVCEARQVSMGGDVDAGLLQQLEQGDQALG